MKTVHVVSVSGGKDSTATLLLALERVGCTINSTSVVLMAETSSGWSPPTMNKRKMPKCRICGGYCGKHKGQRCQFAANQAKKQGDDLWTAVTAGLRQKGTNHD